jgi:glycosyltransferase involved in cell wall biosynthesis
MNIAFICDSPPVHAVYWNDGLKAALGVLVNQYKWEVDIFNVQTDDLRDIKKDIYDIGLFWGSLIDPAFQYKYFKKQALCFGGGPTFSPALHNFDLIFAESKTDFLDFKRFGKKVIQAFGTNTKLFKPMPDQPKSFSYLYPAAFAKWKHHEKFVEFIKEKESKYAIELPPLAVGHIQENGVEKECYEICQKNYISVLPQVPYSVMPYLINASEHVYLSPDESGGCQRAVLEAKACGVDVVIDTDSPKLVELSKLTPEQVRENWSEEAYANKLKKGLEELINEKDN